MSSYYEVNKHTKEIYNLEKFNHAIGHDDQYIFIRNESQYITCEEEHRYVSEFRIEWEDDIHIRFETYHEAIEYLKNGSKKKRKIENWNRDANWDGS